MTVALFVPDAKAADRWVAALAAHLPGWRIEPMDRADLNAVRYAVVWKPRTGDLARLPNLRAIVSIGAGIDHVLADTALPEGVPIIRTVGRDLTQRMREYVALHVLAIHRDYPRQAMAQREGDWRPIVPPPASGRVVGVMGLGNLGTAAAVLLSQIGFSTRGWSHGAKALADVATYGGDRRDAFLDGCEILVNLLPLTPATKGILNADVFARLAPGAGVVNCARGAHLVEADLLAALDSGRIGHATLDVFDTEPLPAGHPFWTHPRVTVTPHIAARIDPATGARLISENLRTFEATGTCADLADVARGY